MYFITGSSYYVGDYHFIFLRFIDGYFPLITERVRLHNFVQRVNRVTDNTVTLTEQTREVPWRPMVGWQWTSGGNFLCRPRKNLLDNPRQMFTRWRKRRFSIQAVMTISSKFQTLCRRDWQILRVKSMDVHRTQWIFISLQTIAGRLVGTV